MIQKDVSDETIAARWNNRELMDAAMKEAYYEAIRENRRWGLSMVFWQDGKIVEISPFDLPLPEDQLAEKPVSKK